jgi:hypothetical protein
MSKVKPWPLFPSTLCPNGNIDQKEGCLRGVYKDKHMVLLIFEIIRLIVETTSDQFLDGSGGVGQLVEPLVIEFLAFQDVGEEGGQDLAEDAFLDFREDFDEFFDL